MSLTPQQRLQRHAGLCEDPGPPICVNRCRWIVSRQTRPLDNLRLCDRHVERFRKLRMRLRWHVAKMAP